MATLAQAVAILREAKPLHGLDGRALGDVVYVPHSVLQVVLDHVAPMESREDSGDLFSDSMTLANPDREQQ